LIMSCIMLAVVLRIERSSRSYEGGQT
jgi:hypothetical protein